MIIILIFYSAREEMEKRGFEAYGEFQNVYLKAVQRRALDERYGSEKAAAYEDLSLQAGGRLQRGDNQLKEPLRDASPLALRR